MHVWHVKIPILSLCRRIRLVAVRIRDARGSTSYVADIGRDALAGAVQTHYGAFRLVGVESLENMRDVEFAEVSTLLRTCINDGLRSISAETGSISVGSVLQKTLLTLSDEMPPRRIQRVVSTPGNVLAIGLTRAILQLVSGTHLCLVI